MASSSDWKAYQEQARDFFLALGLDAKVEVEVQGARALHAIDVYVSFTRFGIQQRWLVECKHWKTAVPKENIMAFHAIIQDTGADKGFLLCEAGFQAGAVRAAAATNIVLTSLDTLKSEADEELTSVAIDSRLRAFDVTLAKMHNMKWRQEYRKEDRDGLVWHSPPDYFELIGRLCILETSLRAATRGEFPVLIELNEKEGTRHLTDNVDELVDCADQLLGRASKYLEQHRDFRSSPKG